MATTFNFNNIYINGGDIIGKLSGNRQLKNLIEFDSKLTCILSDGSIASFNEINGYWGCWNGVGDDDPVLGLNAPLDQDIAKSLIIGNDLYLIGKYGKIIKISRDVSSYNIETIFDVKNEQLFITDAIHINDVFDYIVAGTIDGRVIEFDITNKYFNFNSIRCSDGKHIVYESITSIININTDIYISSIKGKIAKFDGYTWYDFDNIGLPVNSFNNEKVYLSAYNNLLFAINESGITYQYNSGWNQLATCPIENISSVKNENSAIYVGSDIGKITLYNGSWATEYSMQEEQKITDFCYYSGNSYNKMFTCAESKNKGESNVIYRYTTAWAKITDTYAETSINKGISETNILGACIFDDKLVIINSNGYTSYYNFVNYQLYSYEEYDPQGLVSINSFDDSKITSIDCSPVAYNLNGIDYLIVPCNSGQIAVFKSYNGNEWYYPGDTSINNLVSNIFSETNMMGGSKINCMYVFDNILLLAGNDGRVASFDGENWKKFDGTGAGEALYNNELIFGRNDIINIIHFNDKLYFLDSSGRIVSCDIERNKWKVENFANIMGGAKITSLAVYNDELIFGNKNGYVSSLNKENKKGSLEIIPSELIGNAEISSMFTYNNIIMFAGSNGNIAIYDGYILNGYNSFMNEKFKEINGNNKINLFVKNNNKITIFCDNEVIFTYDIDGNTWIGYDGLNNYPNNFQEGDLFTKTNCEFFMEGLWIPETTTGFTANNISTKFTANKVLIEN